VQVDLGLATAGDTVEQQRSETGGHRAHGLDRLALLVVGLGSVREPGRCADGLRDAFDETALHQDARGGTPSRAGVVESRLVARARGQPFAQPARRARTHARARGLARPGQLPRPRLRVRERFTPPQRRRQCGVDDLAEAGVGVALQPAQRREQFAVEQRLRIEQRDHRAHLGRRGGGRTDPGHDADQLARTERDPDPAPHRRALRRRRVVEQPRHRQWQRDLPDRASGRQGRSRSGRGIRCGHRPSLASGRARQFGRS
jgi:hypothetical protein